MKTNLRSLVKGQPISYRLGIYPTGCVDDEYVIRVFRSVWKRIPQNPRQCICDYVTNRKGPLIVECAYWLKNEKLVGRYRDSRLEILLCDSYVDIFPEAALIRVISHELAHAYDYAAFESKRHKLELEPSEETERRVDAYMIAWGFSISSNKNEMTDDDDKRILENRARRKQMWLDREAKLAEMRRKSKKRGG